MCYYYLLSHMLFSLSISSLYRQYKNWIIYIQSTGYPCLTLRYVKISFVQQFKSYTVKVFSCSLLLAKILLLKLSRPDDNIKLILRVIKPWSSLSDFFPDISATGSYPQRRCCFGLLPLSDYRLRKTGLQTTSTDNTEDGYLDCGRNVWKQFYWDGHG